MYLEKSSQFKGFWVKSAPYTPDAIVLYEGTFYKCLRPHNMGSSLPKTGMTPDLDKELWMKMRVKSTRERLADLEQMLSSIMRDVAKAELLASSIREDLDDSQHH